MGLDFAPLPQQRMTALLRPQSPLLVENGNLFYCTRCVVAPSGILNCTGLCRRHQKECWYGLYENWNKII